MRYTIAIYALVFLLLVNLCAFATLFYNQRINPQQCPALDKSCNSIDFMTRYLELSDEQLRKVTALRDEYGQEIAAIQVEMAMKRRELLHEIRKSQSSSEKIEQAIVFIGDLQMKLQRLSIQNMIKEKEILSEKQRSKLYDAMESWCCSNRLTNICDRPGPVADQTTPHCGKN